MVNTKKERIHIVLATDNNYVPHLAVTLVSVLKNNTSNNEFVFHILDGNISNDNKVLLTDIVKKQSNSSSDISFYDMSSFDFSDFNLYLSHISIATYYRLFLLRILPKEISKVIYLDCDLLVVSDLSELWNTDLSSNMFAAVIDQNSSTLGPKINIESNCKYFNAGVLLLNLDLMRANNFEQVALNYYKENKEQLKFQDQDVLNGVANGNFLELPLSYNAFPCLFRQLKISDEAKDKIKKLDINEKNKAKNSEVKCSISNNGNISRNDHFSTNPLIFNEEHVLNKVDPVNNDAVLYNDVITNAELGNEITDNFRKEVLVDAILNPKIVHFSGPEKPWNTTIVFHRYYQDYFKYLAETPFEVTRIKLLGRNFLSVYNKKFLNFFTIRIFCIDFLSFNFTRREKLIKLLGIKIYHSYRTKQSSEKGLVILGIPILLKYKKNIGKEIIKTKRILGFKF